MTRLRFQTSAGHLADVTLVMLPKTPRERDWQLLTAGERARADRFKFEAGRTAFVTTRAALRRRLSEIVGAAPDALEIEADQHGRPLLRARTPVAIDFNVSHCHGMAALAVVRGGRIGVDVEAHTGISDLRDVVPSVMGERERALLQNLTDTDFTRAFYGSWTRKEAIVKAIGVGLSYPVGTIDLPSASATSVFRFQTAPDMLWRVVSLEPMPALTLSIAIADNARWAPTQQSGTGARSGHVAAKHRRRDDVVIMVDGVHTECDVPASWVGS